MTKQQPPTRKAGKRGNLSAWFHHQTRAAKVAAGLFAALAAMLGAMAAIDARYAGAAEYRRDHSELRNEFRTGQLANEIAFLNLRRSQVLDRVYALQAKERGGRMLPYERQELARFTQEANDLGREINAKQRILDQARVR